MQTLCPVGSGERRGGYRGGGRSFSAFQEVERPARHGTQATGGSRRSEAAFAWHLACSCSKTRSFRVTAYAYRSGVRAAGAETGAPRSHTTSSSLPVHVVSPMLQQSI